MQIPPVLDHTFCFEAAKYKKPVKTGYSKYNLLDPSSAELLYKKLPKDLWIEQKNLMAEIDIDGVEFEEVPEDYKGQEGLFYAQQRERINKHRKIIYRFVIEDNNLNPKEHKINDVLGAWSSIVDINSERAIIEIERDKRVLIRGDVANFIVGYLLKNGRRKKQVLYTAYAKSLGLEKWNTQTRNKVSSALLRLVSKDYLLEDVTKYNEQYYRVNEAIYKAENGKFYFKKG